MPTAVHPHGCGEQRLTLPLCGIAVGSSPRVWGTGQPSNPPDRGSRFIPTGVGNRAAQWPQCRRCSVHPHGCGEQGILTTKTQNEYGSSPRVWGTEISFLRVRVKNRFIPTGVGNRHGVKCCDVTDSVHPHGCGEQMWSEEIRFSFSGSSPRVWGTGVRDGNFVKCNRFIPTGVGNRMPRLCSDLH